MRRRPTPASWHSPGACGGAGVPLLRRLSAAAPQLGKLNGTRRAARNRPRGAATASACPPTAAAHPFSRISLTRSTFAVICPV